jgi:molybdopterin-biosynthesis enzyme MoeA-like protein
MNANELADFVEISKPDDKTHQAIATMLRQQEVEIERITSKYEEMLHEQQAEIETLKAENKFFKDLMGDVEILKKASGK